MNSFSSGDDGPIPYKATGKPAAEAGCFGGPSRELMAHEEMSLQPGVDSQEIDRVEGCAARTGPLFLPSTLATEVSSLQRAVVGDRAAFGWIVRRYNQRLYRVARTVLRDDAEAKDALQDAYIAAYRALGTFRGKSALSTWLTRIVLNECRARQRIDRRHQGLLPTVSMDSQLEATNGIADTGEQPDGLFERAQMRSILEREIDGLPDSLRVVFVLRAVEEMSVKEAARCLGISEATVRIRHFRARRLLREGVVKLVDSVKRELYDFGGRDCDNMVTNVLARLDRDLG